MSTQLVMYRGDDRDFDMTLTEEGVPFELTDYTVVFTAREDIDDEAVVFSLTSADGGVEILPNQANPANTGKVTVHVPASATAGMDRGVTLVCDLELTDGDGNIRTAPEPSWGESTLIKLKVRADVTHA